MTGITLLFPAETHSQVQKSGSIREYVYDIIDNMPGADGQDYRVPSSGELTAWKEVISGLLAGDYQSTATRAADMHYQLVDFTDGGTRYYILERDDAATGPYWGTYIYRPGACRNIVIQSPHPKFDMNTGKEGIYVFSHADAFFFCLSGTHRCNASSYSGCSGTTTVCSGSSEPYRVSDPAHNVQSVFHTVTKTLHEYDSTLVFIQLHGFAKRTDDPYVIMSNCTRITPDPDYIVQLKNNLRAVDPVLTFRIAHINLSWTRLIAFSNVQGRYLGNSPDPCHENADTTFGTFIHIEQEKSRLREDSSQWEKMSRAVINTFPCRPAGVTSPAPPDNIRIYPNPTGGKITLDLGKEENTLTLRLLTVTGKEILQKHYRNTRKPELTVPGPEGFYLIEIIPAGKNASLIKILKK